MPDLSVVRGTDTTHSNSGLALGSGQTFDITGSFSTITVTDDDNNFEGDQNINETPDDLNQTVNIGGNDVAVVYEYSFTASYDGVTYTFAILDVDLNDDGDIGNGFVGGDDPGEQVYYIAVIGPSVPVIPAGGATFTVQTRIADNSNLPFSDFICFAAGTLIQTSTGLIPVELIRPDTLIQTMDNGFEPVVWAGQRAVIGQGGNAPVRIAQGRLGNDRDLVVSPQHRMLMHGWKPQMYLQEDELFAAAKHLIDGAGIQSVPCPKVTYVHLLFENHEVIFAEGAATESLHPHRAIKGDMGRQCRDEIMDIFPELAQDPSSFGPTARTCCKSFEASLLV